MFKDLKEYQDITRIYNESVNISEEQRAINKAIEEAEFTPEEIKYLDENFDELWESELETLTEEIIAEQEQLDEMAAKVAKVAVKAAPKIGGLLKKGISAVAKKLPIGVKKAAKGVGGALKKVGGVLKKALPVAAGAALGGGLGVGAVKAVQAIGDKKKADKAKKDAALDAKIKQGIKDSGMGDKGTAITQKGRDQAMFNRGERKARKDLKDPTLNDNLKKKTDPPKATETKPKKKMHPIEKKNRARFGDAHVDKLKSKNKDFKAMKKGGMSKDDFIKKYPKSITAQKAAGLRDHTEWDAYDMVLEYLFSTEQVTSLEEANYVMMEMEQQTIGEIVKEVKVALNEDV